MSTESAHRVFSRMDYPSLGGGGEDIQRAAEQAKAQGHAAGYAAGLHAAATDTERLRAEMQAEFDAEAATQRARMDYALQLLSAAERSIRQLTLPVIEQVQDALAAAALDLAEAVLGRELADGESSARAALTRALAGVQARDVHAVRMHPADLDILGDEALNRAGVVFTPDPGLQRGDAVTDFADGFLDATLATALARAKTALRGEPA